MLPLLEVVGILVASVLVLVFHGGTIRLALAMITLGPAPPSLERTFDRVTAIVAARNEEADLPGDLDSLLAQDYPALEIIVVDGGSTDRSREIVRARAPRVRLIDEPPLPAGWVGKNWACHQGSLVATGSYLLFTDADVHYHPATVRTSVQWAEAERADLVTLTPRLETVGFWEKVVVPFMAQVILTYFRTPRVNRADSRTAMANGQYLLIRKEAYDAIGGHAAVRGAVLEDVRIAQELRRLGRPMRVAWAPELISTRMYRDRRELFEGLLKNVHGTRFSLARQVGFLVALVGLFYLPLGVLPLGLAVGSWPLVAMGGFLYVALFAKHVGFARGVRSDPRYGLLFPLAVGFYLVLVTSSIVRGVKRRPIEWKGRAYRREA